MSKRTTSKSGCQTTLLIQLYVRIISSHSLTSRRHRLQQWAKMEVRGYPGSCYPITKCKSTAWVTGHSWHQEAPFYGLGCSIWQCKAFCRHFLIYINMISYCYANSLTESSHLWRCTLHMAAGSVRLIPFLKKSSPFIFKGSTKWMLS